MADIFLKPEKPFFLLWKESGEETHEWFETQEELSKFIKLNKGYYADFEIVDMFEIGSLRGIVGINE